MTLIKTNNTGYPTWILYETEPSDNDITASITFGYPEKIIIEGTAALTQATMTNVSSMTGINTITM